jgi:aminopeptidase YwaD
MDNASGMAVALAVARCLAPHVAAARRGLKLAFYHAEIVMNVNLDSVAGARRLTALVSGFPRLVPFVRKAAAPLGVHVPLMTNSDHANFASRGIPALRLVAGFDDPSSEIRHVLTAADTRDKVTKAELHAAAVTTAELVWMALSASDSEMARWRERP